MKKVNKREINSNFFHNKNSNFCKFANEFHNFTNPTITTTFLINLKESK